MKLVFFCQKRRKTSILPRNNVICQITVEHYLNDEKTPFLKQIAYQRFFHIFFEITCCIKNGTKTSFWAKMTLRSKGKWFSQYLKHRGGALRRDETCFFCQKRRKTSFLPRINVICQITFVHYLNDEKTPFLKQMSYQRFFSHIFLKLLVVSKMVKRRHFGPKWR